MILNENKILEQDDMIFEPYLFGGWHCKMEISKGTISVRMGGYGLMADRKHPYEVWYPERDVPDGYQTANDVWGYINESLNK